ncbi:MAG: hypothetical protein HYU64_16635, partial [Armatimonadetes bacterium]|nr:hypothetical protein [Armatimonadota bacterium]
GVPPQGGGIEVRPGPAASSAGLHYVVEVLGDYGSFYRLLTAIGGFSSRMIVDRVILKTPDEKVLPRGAKPDSLSALVLISVDQGILRDSWERTMGREPAVSIAFRPVRVKYEAPVSQGKKPVVTANNASSAPPLPPPPDTLDTASKGTSETGTQKPSSPFAGEWRLKGVIGEKGKDQVALIEHGGQGYYLRAGDVQNGAKVIQILPDSVILLVGGSEIELTLPK